MIITSAFSGYSSNDIESCRDFYSSVLELKLTSEMGGIGFKINGQQIYIYNKDNHTPATYTVLNFVVDSIEQAVDELVSKGVRFKRYDNLPAEQDDRGILRGKDAGYGPNIAWFKDPAGNILSLVEK